jgi:hypothetical protein
LSNARNIQQVIEQQGHVLCLPLDDPLHPLKLLGIQAW